MKTVDALLLKCSLSLNPDEKRIVRGCISIFPIVFVCCALFVKVTFPWRYYLYFQMEDGMIEYATAIVYFLGFLISLSIFRSFMVNRQYIWSVLYFILTIGLFFIAMEEISWFQRIIGYQTPQDIKAINDQGEFNFHNLKYFPLHGLYEMVGLYGAFSGIILAALFNNKHDNIFQWLIPESCLFFYFLIIFAVLSYCGVFSALMLNLFDCPLGCEKGHFIVAKDQEPAEFLLGMGFLLFVLMNRSRQLKELSVAASASAGEPGGRRAVSKGLTW